MKIRIEAPVFNIKDKKVTADISCPKLSATATFNIKVAEVLPYFTNKVSLDLLFISAFVYGVDRFIDRHSHSEDAWSRVLEVKLPVYDVKIWQSNKLQLEKILSFLTGDYWNLSFYKNTLELPNEEFSQDSKKNFEQINLFSGGLDSLIGAIDFLESNPTKKLIVVSHVDPNISAKNEQDTLRAYLKKKYPNNFYFLPSVSAGLSQSSNVKEKTFRSRSLLFISIAILVANDKKMPILVPENGTVSLNYPLSSSRRSACSTRTTHPTFLKDLNELLHSLKIKSFVENIYEFKTKGEMVADCKNLTFLKKVYKESISCGKRGHKANWDNMTVDQCGVCMPCIYRQASLQSFPDRTSYGNSINKKVTGRRHKTPFLLSKQGQDFAACLAFLKKDLSDEAIRNELMINGIINIEKLDSYVELIKRSRKELVSWIKKKGDVPLKVKAGIK